MTEPLFISSPSSVLTGDAARAALSQTNDAAYLTEGKGVLSVPLERWQYAQGYEAYTWLTQGVNLTEDRNTEHADMFDNYKSLPIDLGHVIELGCGPFTNMRHIIPGRQARTIALLDPLASSYFNHPHCAYIDKTIIGQAAQVIPFAIEDYDLRLLYAQIDHPPGGRYNTVIMINVLSHCRDIDKVFKWFDDHLKRGGYLVFHEPARDINPLEWFDVGHPLSYTQAVIDDFLSGYEPVYKNGDYFIGVKK